jgi:hypothetical protein
VLLTARKRRRIVKVVLPLLVVVWASLPWLPCCQDVAADGAAGAASVAHASAERAAPQHAGHADMDHVIAHADHGTAVTADLSESSDRDLPGADSEASSPLCADVDKNHNEARPAAASDVLLVGPTLIVPVLSSLIGTSDPLGDPPRPTKRRPLHLAKSVLLI